MGIFSFEGKQPDIDASAYVSPTAMVVGRVTIGQRCYIGHGAILRGDYGCIEIGDETAIEEGVIIHARPSDWTRIGRRVTVGHGAMIHNAVIHDGAVIGMRAVVSDFSEVGAGAIVGEMGLVKNGQQVPPASVAVGIPVKVVGEVEEKHRAMTHWAKDLYADLAGRYAGGAMVELDAPAGARGLPQLRAIGTIRTPRHSVHGGPKHGGQGSEMEGEVIVESAFREGLADLEGFSHLVLLFWLNRSEGYSLKVTPHLDTEPRGLFSTRSPRRPNPIGLTVVRLLEVNAGEGRLKVAGVDMLDGTPLLDIKPHVPSWDSPDDPLDRQVERRGKYHRAA